MYKKILKRLIDLCLSMIGIILFSPIILVIAIFIKIDSKGPIVFKQVRLGLEGKEFNIYKFRTMVVNAEKMEGGVYTNGNDFRVTKIGKILRATSLDEIPQFFNILKGDMSFIGPRPPLNYHPWIIEKYTKKQKKMFCVRPGITGYAQINGRKDVEWNKRIKMNVWYVENMSFILDIKIACMTVIKVLKNENNINKKNTVER